MSKIFYTSDHHFFHTNIIEYADRPFVTMDEMNREMVSRWNLKVKPGDIVYHIGDFSFGGRRDIKLICDMLHGTKILIKGNHDRHTNTFYRDVGFERVYKKHLPISTQHMGDVLLSHRPIPHKDRRILDGYNWNFCGHGHNYYKMKGKQINLCVEAWDYEPVTEIEILRSLI
jgi:calcineurin-like phosphoesterase family protein